jgi:hypothetical protein
MVRSSQKKGIFVFPRKMKTEIKCKEKFKWYVLKEKKNVFRGSE